MLDILTSQDFEQCQNNLFKVILNERQEYVELVLVKATIISSSGLRYAKRESFSLLFKGPPDRFLPQGVYSFKNEDMGNLTIFLVPIGQDADGVHQYEAIFN